MPSESMEIRMTVEVETMVVIVKGMKLMRQSLAMKYSQ